MKYQWYTICVLALAFTISGCPKQTANNNLLDVDNDGFTVEQGDCNDNNDAINPDADEICDGVDNDCDGTVDGMERDCYSGPEGTEGVGACTGGTQICDAGSFGACEGQVLPDAEICGDDLDNDCNGALEETCSETPCDQIALDSEIEITNTCLTQNTEAKSLVKVTLRNAAGEAFEGQHVRFSVGGQGQLGAEQGELANVYYVSLGAGYPLGEHEIKARISCGGNTEVELDASVSLTIAEATLVNQDGIITGGCSPKQGNLQVRVIDEETGSPIAEATVLVGLAGDIAFEENASNAIATEAGQGDPVEPNNLKQTNEEGIAAFLDFTDQLALQSVVTVQVENYEMISLGSLNSGQVTIALKRNDFEIGMPVTIEGDLRGSLNQENDGQVAFGIVFPAMNLEQIRNLSIGPANATGFDCWDPVIDPNSQLAALPPVRIPSNLYVPAQTEDIPETDPPTPFPINVHDFSIHTNSTSPMRTMGVMAQMPLLDSIALLGSGENILDEFVGGAQFREIGITTLDPNNPADLIPNIMLTGDLVENATCRVQNAPENTGVLCFTAGNWSETGEIEELIPLDITVMRRDALFDAGDVAVSQPLSTVPAEGAFEGMQHLGVAIAMDLLDGGPRPEGGYRARSIQFDRTNLSGEGGEIVMDSFLKTTSLNYAPPMRLVSWSNVWNESPEEVDYCKVKISRVIFQINELECGSDSKTQIASIPIWTAYVRGENLDFRLPELLPQNLVSIEESDEEDIYQATLECLSNSQDFDFNHGRFKEVETNVTHITSNILVINDIFE